MLALTALLASLAAAGSSVVHASVLPLIGSRAPHFAQIIQPTSGYVLNIDSGVTQPSFLFTYRNGERADETTASVSLQNDTGVFPLATGLQFVDNWYTVNTTITFASASIASGDYSLLAQEQFEGQTVSEYNQPITIKHSGPASDAAAGVSSSSVQSSSASSSSSSSVAASSSASSSSSSTSTSSSATSVTASSASSSAKSSATAQPTSIVAVASTPSSKAQPGSIEQALRSLLAALVA